MALWTERSLLDGEVKGCKMTRHEKLILFLCILAVLLWCWLPNFLQEVTK
jgi:hypothetical protein